jgi:LSD1 subclass zinc finger protein
MLSFYSFILLLLTMPKYAVVICPDCRNPFIVEPGPKTVSCRHCNKRQEAAKLRVFIATDDFRQAQAAIGSINAHVCGDPTFDAEIDGMLPADSPPLIDGPRFKKDKARVDEKMREAAKQTRQKGQTAILTDTFDELAATGEVDVEEYWTRVAHSGITRKKFDEWVDKMVDTGRAYSPKFGYLRKG